MTMRIAVGVDIGGTAVKMGLAGEDGTLLSVREFPTRVERGGENILPDVAGMLPRMLADLAVPMEQIISIGLAVPGPVMSDGTVNRCLNLGWGRSRPQDTLQALTGLPVTTLNDGSAAALGEMWLGSARDCRDFVMLTLGTGIGGGIVVDGRPLTGADGSAGEVGHILVDLEEKEACVCGNRGCLEQYASATGLVRTYRQAIRSGAEGPAGEHITAKDISQAARAGSPAALWALERCAAALGRGMAILATILNPQRFILGGGMAQSGDLLIVRAEETFRQHAFHAASETPIVLAQLGNAAAVMGCAYAALHHM